MSGQDFFKQVGGTHYEQMPIQPFEIIDAFGLDFYGGNALKYLLRAGRKPGADVVEELKKARHYLDEMISRAEAATR
jgi:hypothetical protein